MGRDQREPWSTVFRQIRDDEPVFRRFRAGINLVLEKQDGRQCLTVARRERVDA